MIWSKGHIERVWNDDFKSFPYIKQPITEVEIQNWHSQGYDYIKSFSGSMYDNRNPMPDWVRQLDNRFGLSDQVYCFYKMKTLEIMPTHKDYYVRYRELFGVESKNVYRVLLMLEDWKPGHYFEIDGCGQVNWHAGDYFIWNFDCAHAASNIGIEDRYTLQITGTRLE